MDKTGISDKTVGRLSVYRRILALLREEGVFNVHSHELAARAGASAAQVRRDLMATGYEGSPKHGYVVEQLSEALERFLDAPSGQSFALIGVGNLGRALLAYFGGRRPKLRISAGFDKNPKAVGRVIHGCRCYSMEEMKETVAREGISLAIIAVPASEAQKVSEQVYRCGIKGFLNFAPVALRMPADSYVEHVDLTMSLEKVAFFAR